MMSQYVPDHLDGLEIDKHSSGKDKYSSPEKESDNRHDEHLLAGARFRPQKAVSKSEDSRAKKTKEIVHGQPFHPP